MQQNFPTLLRSALGILLPVSLVVLTLIWLGTNFFLQRSVENELRVHLEANGQREVARITTRLASLSAFARTVAINDLIINGLIDVDGRASYLPTFFRSLAPPASSGAIVALLDYRGRVIASNSPGTSAGSLNIYNLDLEKSSLVITRSAVNVLEPVMYNGFVEGAIILSYSPLDFPALYGHSRFGDDFFIINDRDVVLYGSNPSLSLAEIKKDFQSETWITVNKDLGSTDRKLIVAVNLQSRQKLLTDFNIAQIVGLVLFGSAFIGLLVFAAKFMTRPLSSLASEISDIHNVQGLVVPLKVEGPSEIARLAIAFNEMGQSLGAALLKEQMLELNLRQAKKLESVGQMACGVAHELNTPCQYIGDNLRFVDQNMSGIFDVIEVITRLENDIGDPEATEEKLQTIIELVKSHDLNYILKEFRVATAESLEGIIKVSGIISALQEFSSPMAQNFAQTSINQLLQNAVIVSRNVWHDFADVKLDLDETLPEIHCCAADINQVLLNMIMNSTRAIEDSCRNEGEGLIVISTRQECGNLELRIADNGCGIPDAVRDRVFDPFFTTKEHGQGTGHGLAVAYDLIVNKHCGVLEFENSDNGFTTFLIRLPLETELPQPVSAAVSNQ
ncbi:MAG: hypothetical protein COB90_00760 [Hyphomicrobiales bacterium]|nr:MAG: hypothetical protein COB90_00760 [Hyphomicrobiales bacterium]